MAGPRITRRSILAGAATASALALPGLAHAVSHTDAAAAGGRFTHNVASGDPLATRVILWTRYVPASADKAELSWEVAEDEAFSKIISSGKARTSAAQDYTLKVDASGLKPARWYYYRFKAGDNVSPTGRTKTLPVGNVPAFNMAVFSCSNLPFGYFNAYAHAAARDDIDLALHVGDYIYEYERGRYPSVAQALADRIINPATEIVSLQDYRDRYAIYRADPDLQEVHRRLPFVVVWDDHELTNDAYKGGAENHQSDTEGPWDVRLKHARQAYQEWMPIRVAPTAPLYRRFDIGTLATLFMLDTREVGRDKQLEYADDLGVDLAKASEAELAAACQKFARTKWDVPSRTLLGQPQERWLEAELKKSVSKGVTWQVLGQQIQTALTKASPAIEPLLRPQLPEFSRRFANIAVKVGQHGLPFNQDAWAGYPAARRRLLRTFEATGANAVFLSGDTHNHWAFNLMGEAPNGLPSAVEFGGGSVTSPGLEGLFSDHRAAERVMVQTNPEMAWMNMGARGYITVRFTPEAAQCTWLGVSTVRSKDFTVEALQTATVSPVKGPGIGRMQLDIV
jgi:alkaline phosphatase D